MDSLCIIIYAVWCVKCLNVISTGGGWYFLTSIISFGIFFWALFWFNLGYAAVAVAAFHVPCYLTSFRRFWMSPLVSSSFSSSSSVCFAVSSVASECWRRYVLKCRMTYCIEFLYDVCMLVECVQATEWSWNKITQKCVCACSVPHLGRYGVVCMKWNRLVSENEWSTIANIHTRRYLLV